MNPGEVARVFEREPSKVFLTTASELIMLHKASDCPPGLSIFYRAGELVLFGLSAPAAGEGRAGQGQ